MQSITSHKICKGACFMNKVSIIIPVYNVEKYLSDCLDSCICQSYKNIEIICVNDKSTDNSINILEEYAQKDARIKIINNKKNQGLAISRNIGIDNANGEYLIFLDSDDILPPKALSHMVEKIIKEDGDLVVCDYFRFCDDKSNIRNIAHNDNFLKILKKLSPICSPGDIYSKLNYYEIWEDVYFMCVWAKLFKTSILNQYNIRAPKVRCAEDFLMVKEYIFNCKKILLLEDFALYYRKHKGSFTQSKNSYALDILKTTLPTIEMYKKYDFYNHEKGNIYTFFINSCINHLKCFTPYFLYPKFLFLINQMFRYWDKTDVLNSNLLDNTKFNFMIYRLPFLLLVFYFLFMPINKLMLILMGKIFPNKHMRKRLRIFYAVYMK